MRPRESWMEEAIAVAAGGGVENVVEEQRHNLGEGGGEGGATAAAAGLGVDGASPQLNRGGLTRQRTKNSVKWETQAEILAEINRLQDKLMDMQ